jgi:hypothetical protein
MASWPLFTRRTSVLQKLCGLATERTAAADVSKLALVKQPDSESAQANAAVPQPC